MQEYHQLVRDALKNGLRSDARARRGIPACEELRNLKPTEFGAVSPEVIDYPLASPAFPVSPTWPFPQFKPATAGLFLFTGAAVYSVNETNWTASALSLFQAASQGSAATLGANGGDVHVANFLNSWWATDGVNLIFNTPGNLSSRTFVFATAALACNSVEVFGDRLFLGGLSGTTLAGSRFLSFFNLWKDTAAGRTYTAANEGWDLNYLLWSDEFGGDSQYPFEALKYILGLSLGGTPQDNYTDAVVRDLIEAGKIGILPLDATGDVLALKSMGNRLIAYGRHGVSAVIPVEYKSLGLTNVVGFQEQPVKGVNGIAGRGGVGGDDGEHIWIGNDGDLWRVGSDGADRLGYKEFVDGLVVADGIIGLDRQERDFWISDGITCYVRSRTGLGGPLSILPSSVVRSPYSTALVGTAPEVDFSAPEPGGVPPDLDSTDPDIVLARTVPFDFGQRTQKHVTALQIGVEGMRDVRGTVHYRFDTVTAYRRKIQRKTSKEGLCRIDANALDLKVEVLGVAPTQAARIDYVDVRYQFDDRREVRGAQGLTQQQS